MSTTIPGVKLIKSSSGKITGATLSMKYHKQILEDLIDSAELKKGLQDEMVPWEEAKAKLQRRLKKAKK